MSDTKSASEAAFFAVFRISPDDSLHLKERRSDLEPDAGRDGR
jgi:hypothetical protein